MRINNDNLINLYDIQGGINSTRLHEDIKKKKKVLTYDANDIDSDFNCKYLRFSDDREINKESIKLLEEKNQTNILSSTK